MLLTLPGLPLIYNGDEVGAQFLPYEEQPLSWDDRHGLLADYTRLVRLRKEIPALHSPDMTLLATNHDDAVLAYIRRPSGAAMDCPQSARALVLLNFSDKPLELALSSGAAGLDRLQDRLTGERFDDAASKPLRLKPFDARILTEDTKTCD
jgi:glycosidase